MKKKGFTLIELLAVIIIVAILMIIAIPNILNTLATSRKKAFIAQAQSIYKSAEQQFAVNSMNNNYITCYEDGGTNQLNLGSKSADLKYYVKVNSVTGKVDEIEVQDTGQGFKIVLAKSSGNSYVLQNEVAGATITTNATGSRSIGTCSGGGTSNNNSGNNDPGNGGGSNTPVIEPDPNQTFGGVCEDAPSGNEEHSGLPATYKGICYFDPKDFAASCDSSSELTSGNTGCKKFYIFDDSGTKYRMIMDRNTTASTLGTATTGESNTQFEQLAIDTAGWVGSKEIISAHDVAKILGDNDFDYTSERGSSGYYFGAKDKYYYEQTDAENAKQKSFYWLFDNTDGCGYYGCITEDSSVYGYWTSTMGYGSFRDDNNFNDFVWSLGDKSYVWYVSYYGAMYTTWAIMKDTKIGVRPVLEIPKSWVS